jgi:phosphoribosyl-AMP cyclohydrolase
MCHNKQPLGSIVMIEPGALAQDIKWNEQGLVPVITQDWQSGEVLMLAWMNREALQHTLAEGRVIYWSRSRGKLWRKGEESGHIQHLKELRIDCDADTVLVKVEQVGGIACHTGRRSCFFQRLENGAWSITEAVVRQPADIYGNKP